MPRIKKDYPELPLLSSENDTLTDVQFMEALAEYSMEGLDGSTTHKKKYVGKDIIIANLPKIYEMLVDGITVKEICSSIGVSKRLWYYFVKENNAFQNVIKSAEQEQVVNVKQSLVNKCKDRYVQKSKVLPNGKIVMFEEFIPSDVNAIKFYLLNKASDEFKEKQEIIVKQTEIIVDIVEMDNYTIVPDDGN